MNRAFAFVVAPVMILGAGILPAQESHARIVPGERAALRIPPAAFVDSLVDSSRGVIRVAAAVRSGSAVPVNGRDEWASAGFVPATSVLVDSVRIDRRTRQLDVTVLGNAIGIARVHIPLADTAFVIPRLFAPASDTPAVESAVREAVRARIFAGAMAVVPPAAQAALLQVVQSNLHFGPLPVVSAEGRPYLALRTRESTYTCAGRPITDPQRLGDALEEVALPLIWNLGHAAPALPGTFGYAVTVQMKREYSCGSEPAPGDSLTIYVGADGAGDFAAGRISGRSLIGSASVVFRGNRIAVAFSR